MKQVHNGTPCKVCFEMIDITALYKSGRGWGELQPVYDSQDETMKRSEYSFEAIEKGMLDYNDPLQNYDFRMACPHCYSVDHYAYKEVRPLENWKDVIERLEARMTKVEQKFNDPHYLSDLAKMMLKQIDEKSKTAENHEEEKKDDKKSENQEMYR